ncbi:response regulator transcription factor [Sulfitobacter sp. HNIBRBA2951]|uniref:response regulator transcription factor n=1 Tax=Sulfitobacter aquimarinus TaxID=3158557 RepID=UPI0032DE558C
MIKEVLVVEDIAEARAFLIGILHGVFDGIEVSEAVNLRAALDFCQRKQFDLALVDLQLPDGDGYGVLRKLGQTQRNVISIVTTAMGSDSAIVAALSAGANGYVLKSDPPDLIASQISKIPDGIIPLSPAIARRVLSHFRATGPNIDEEVALTPREKEVLTNIGHGLRVAEVAQALSLAPSTVSSHIKSIYRKLNISSRAEAAYQAARLGYLSD